jgi:hypothetical protein
MLGKPEIWFQVDQGMPSPRDGEMGFRMWQCFYDEKSARKAARGLKYARVLEVKLLARIGYEGVNEH